ncbi:unnamed protein product [Paramecium sonneborni]|uniref:Transmembrane protein n=1 Tax=Paramecium sonneborni TaxID=65129 RepID=A0A8S1R474_9CILI|nr:unnamed protein product [Paramecium sonneborni]
MIGISICGDQKVLLMKNVMMVILFLFMDVLIVIINMYNNADFIQRRMFVSFELIKDIQITKLPIVNDLCSRLYDNQNQCLINCEICIQGYCLQCKLRFYLNSISNLCQSICENLIIQGITKM